MTSKCLQAFWGAFRRFQAFWGVFKRFQVFSSDLKRFHLRRFEPPGLVQVDYNLPTCSKHLCWLNIVFDINFYSDPFEITQFSSSGSNLTSVEISRHFMCYYWGLCLILALLGAFCLFWCYRVGFVPTRSIFAEVILTVCVFSGSNEFLSRKNMCRPISSAD